MDKCHTIVKQRKYNNNNNKFFYLDRVTYLDWRLVYNMTL